MKLLRLSKRARTASEWMLKERGREIEREREKGENISGERTLGFFSFADSKETEGLSS